MQSVTTSVTSSSSDTSITTATPAPATAKAKGKPKLSRKPTNLLWRNGWAYFKKSVAGQTKVVALGTQDKHLAQAKVKVLKRQAEAGELAKVQGTRSGRVATCGEIMAAYEGKIKSVNEGIEDNSIAKNLSSFRTFLRWGHGSNGEKNLTVNVEALPATVFADELFVAQFKANYVLEAGDDRLARESRRRGAESILRQSKSLFSKQAMLIYRGLNLPDLTAFRAAAVIETEDRVHLPIAAGTLQDIERAAAKLRTDNPQLWLVHMLQKFFGLRNDEICQARVEWFKRAPWGQVFFAVLRTPYFEPKQSEGCVPVTAEVAALFAPLVQGKQPQDFLIEADSPAGRHYIVNELHAAFMRQFLPATEYAKAGYELRRWASQVMEERYGHEAAKAFLRHAPQGVAERHYFERWFPWRRLGTNVGITIQDALGHREDVAADAWQEGVAVFAPPPVAALQTPEAAKAI
jgi:hypothetical protein